MLRQPDRWLWQPLSLRWKLTLWLMITVVALYVPLCLAGSVFYRDQMLHQVDEQLAALAQQQLGTWPAPTAWQPLPEAHHLLLPPGTPWPAESLSARWSLGEQTLARMGQPPEPGTETATPRFRSGYAEMLLPGGRTVRLTLYLPQSVAEGPLHLLRDGLLMATAAGLAAVGIAGFLMAHQALTPIRHLREAARQLGPDALDHQILLNPTSLEVSRLQDELNEARQRLQRGYAAQERFARNVSHELKTPIAVLLTQTQTLPGRDTLPPPALRFLQITEQEMRRLGRLVESMLLLARLQATEHAPRPLCHHQETIAVGDLLLAATEGAEALAVAAGVALLIDATPFDTDESPSITGHPELLVTMLDNLLRNAIRFSPRGQAVTLTYHRQDDTILLAVRDRGPGLPADLLAEGRLFEPFTQARGEDTRGTGLGLQIARGIAELHGGTLSADNPHDGGARLTAHLPAAPTTP